MMAQVLQIVAEDTRVCSCCGESHAVQECIIARRIVAPGMVAQVPGRYFYCDKADEYFEDHELHAWNEAQAGGFMPPVTVEFGGAAAEGMMENERNDGAAKAEAV